VEYLRSDDPRLRDADPELFDALAGMVQRGTRSVASVRDLGVLPNDTLHHTDPLFFPPGSQPTEKKSIRSVWLERAVAALQDADLVFADPDKCLSESANPLDREGSAYLAPNEVRPLIGWNKSVVIYHHFDRSATAPEQLERAAQLLQKALGRSSQPEATAMSYAAPAVSV
jgi:hypothetical protein